MAYVKCTQHLKRFFPDLGDISVSGSTLSEIIIDLNNRFPGLANYITDEHGALRPHVNVFIGQTAVKDRKQLQDPVSENDCIYIIQAVSGG